MSSPNCPMYIECGFAYSDCDCEIRIFCPDTTSDMHSSCGYEVKDGIAYARYAGGARGGKQAMFNPYHHYASEDFENPSSLSRVQQDKRNGVWLCTFAKDKQAIWDRHYKEKHGDSVTVTYNEKPQYAKAQKVA